MKDQKARRKCSKVIAVLVMLSMLSGILYPIQANAEEAETETIRISAQYGQTEARTMFDMVNEFRTGNNAWVWESDNVTKTTYDDLEPLVYDYDLEQAAMKRAEEIAIYYNHTRPNGTSCFTAYPGGYMAMGENIAAGYRTAEAVFEGWKEEEDDYAGQGHRRNMLSADFNAIGIGHVYYNGCHYWVQEFGKSSKSTIETPANDSSADMEIEILKSVIQKQQVAVTESECSVKCGQTVELPACQVKIQLTKTWPASLAPIQKDAEWIAENQEYVSYSNGSLTGLKAGSTSLKSGIDEQAVIQVTVEHAWDEGTITKKPSCEEKGVKTYTCTGCGDVRTEELEAGHTIVTEEGIPATCTKAGETEGSYCSVCNTVITVSKEIPAKGHTIVTDREIPATCTEAGKTEGSHCSECGVILAEQENIPATGHTPIVEKAIEPTCGTEGMTEGSHCSVCGEALVVAESIPATGEHTLITDEAVEPTCGAEGKTEGSHCSVCGEVLTKQETIPATGKHTYESTRTKATTSKNGTITKKCSVCEETEKTTIYYPKTINLSKTKYTYNGNAQKPSVTVKDSRGKTITSSNYTVSCQSGKNVGIYTVTIKFKNNYSGTVKKTFTIQPKGTSLSSVSAKSKGFIAKWKKQSTQTTGYEIQYSTDSKFKKGNELKDVKKNQTTSQSVTKLKAGKKYYVRIRTYKTVKVNGKSKKIYSDWSKAKSVTAKK